MGKRATSSNSSCLANQMRKILIAMLLTGFLPGPARGSTPPKINWIQLPAYLPGYVLLHFDTEANRTYEVQYLDYAPTNGATWSILATIPPETGPDHYVWPDTLVPGRTQRFYRLKATP